MMQYSVYARVCNGTDEVEKHRRRLHRVLPDNGSIRLLVITEKQFETIEILLGNFREEEGPFACEQLTLF